jgi:hypothetical protein
MGARPEVSMSTKEWLDIVVIPIILVLIALGWPLIQNRHRRRTFTTLIFRELAEVRPYPTESERDKWAEHLTKNFAHRKILQDISQNRDFVLSLNANFVYYLTQLWDAYDDKDEKQWLYYLGKLEEYDKTGKLTDVRATWADLCVKYPQKAK